VTQIELEHGINIGVNLRVLGRDMVPLHEEHEARLERNIRLDEWTSMPRFEKALVVANRRVRIALANLQAEEEIRETNRKTAKGMRRGRR